MACGPSNVSSALGGVLVCCVAQGAVILEGLAATGLRSIRYALEVRAARA